MNIAGVIIPENIEEKWFRKSASPMQKSNANNRPSQKAKKKHRDPVPARFQSLEDEIDFWEKHDLTDYLDYWQEVKNVTVNLVAKHLRLEEELAGRIAKVARQRGISSETLVNLWLQQKLVENSKRAKRRGKAPARVKVASR